MEKDAKTRDTQTTQARREGRKEWYTGARDAAWAGTSKGEKRKDEKSIAFFTDDEHHKIEL